MLLPGLDATSAKKRVALLGEHAVATLPDDANLAYLAVHGTAHAWSRLKWLADFNALLAQVDDRAETLERAKSFSVGRALETALALSQHLFADPPEIIRDPIPRLSLSALASDDEKVIDTAAARARWHLVPGMNYRWQEARIRLRGSNDRLDVPLPARWQFLYPALRVPLWIGRTLRPRDR